MDSGALPRTAAPALGVPGGCAARRRPASPELLRCSRRRRPGAEGAGGGAAAVARRNERERNRVKLVNLGFQALRQHVPHGGASKKLSKVETLRSAVEYIGALQRLLAEHDTVRAALAGGLLAPAARGPPAPPRAARDPPGRRLALLRLLVPGPRGQLGARLPALRLLVRRQRLRGRAEPRGARAARLLQLVGGAAERPARQAAQPEAQGNSIPSEEPALAARPPSRRPPAR